jgi:TorA maturation chaperone TorD
MASLVALERRAAEQSDSRRQGQASICRAAETRFLREHLAWWAPAFARLLSRENAGGFYESVGVFLAALLPCERALLGVPPFHSEAEPSPIERPEECDHCPLAT